MSTHVHVFNGLWWTLGPFGRQDIHLHPCENQRCKTEMVGVGHSCGGKDTKHVPLLLVAGSSWSQKSAEGSELARVESLRDKGGSDG